MKELNLDRFKGFVRPKEQEQQAKKQPEKKRIIGYTRVSSRRQIEGYSLEEQERSIKEFAKVHDFELIDIRGNQYESAKGDFTRKEFKALIEMATKTKPKPYAIAIKFISRFSRSGGNAIGLVEELVSENGIHLIETSTGLCTNTEDGKIAIYEKLLDALRENKERLERTLPGMKSFVEAGNWLGKAPFGYDTYGKRVIDDNKLRGKQKIVLNEDGEHLREAWKWKIQGWTDAQIQRELKEKYGMKISICRLGYIWQNPFYAGVNRNALLDHPVKGNWEAIVSEDDFFKINFKEDPFKARAYNTEGKVEYPLAHFAICSKCGHILVGYPNKKKGIYYYKCKTCKKNYNADTLRHSRNKGLNDVFSDMLSQYSLDERFKEPLIDMVSETLCGGHNVEQCIKTLDKQIDDIRKKEEALEGKYLYEGFPKDKYDGWMKKLNDERVRLEVEKDRLVEKSSNSFEDVRKVIDTICKTHIYWGLEDLGAKKKVQEMVFPQGIQINPENREVLTLEVNPFYKLNLSISVDCESTKKESKADFAPCSQAVAELVQKSNIYRYFRDILECYEYIKSRHPELFDDE